MAVVLKKPVGKKADPAARFLQKEMIKDVGGESESDRRLETPFFSGFSFWAKLMGKVQRRKFGTSRVISSSPLSAQILAQIPWQFANDRE